MFAGQLPVLHVEGASFAQSAAQLRYAGRVAGLYPVGGDTVDHLAALRVDELVETALEVLNKAPNAEDRVSPSVHRLRLCVRNLCSMHATRSNLHVPVVHRTILTYFFGSCVLEYGCTVPVTRKYVP